MFPTTEVEHGRLSLIAKEYGIKEAVQFAERTMRSYRKTTLYGFNKTGRIGDLFRRPLIASYLSFKRFYFQHKDLL